MTILWHYDTQVTSVLQGLRSEVHWLLSLLGILSCLPLSPGPGLWLVTPHQCWPLIGQSRPSPSVSGPDSAGSGLCWSELLWVVNLSNILAHYMYDPILNTHLKNFVTEKCSKVAVFFVPECSWMCPKFQGRFRKDSRKVLGRFRFLNLLESFFLSSSQELRSACYSKWHFNHS